MLHSRLQQGIGNARLRQLSETWGVGQEPLLEVEGEEDMYFRGQGVTASAFCSVPILMGALRFVVNALKPSGLDVFLVTYHKI